MYRAALRAAHPRRLIWPLVAVLTVLTLLLVSIVLFIGILGTATATTASCIATLGPAQAGTAAAGTQAGQLSDSQRQNASIIIATGNQLGVAPRGQLVAIATSMQEAKLRILANTNVPDSLTIPHEGVGSDHDSVGPFQQRASWGTVAERMDTTTSARLFYEALLKVPGWDQLPVSVAAQAVQISAFPDAYAQWEGLAAELVSTLGGVVDISGCGTGGGALPDLPPGIAGAAITFALAQQGKPYVWGATGPDSYDCSGLMLRSYEAAGITLPRTSREQYNAGQHVPLQAAAPGDLLFWAYNKTNPGTIHHVAMYLGNGQIVEAQQSGVPVHIRPVDFTEAGLLDVAARPGT